MERLIVYKASAGSGKTYKLTEEYIRLALSVPFRQILAVTFTNKATAEMKDRITGVLDDLAKGRESSYLPVMMSASGLDEAALRAKAAGTLDDILHNYSWFSVGTIDSFFQRIIRGFARETGLQSGFELELDNRRVLEKVIDRILIETETNSDLRKWLMNYAESRIREGLSWNFRRDMTRLGVQVFSEEFMQFRKELTDKLSDKAFMKSYLSDMHSVKAGFENRMGQIGSDALAFMQERGLSVSDFSYGAAGVAGYFEKISAKKQYEPGKRVLAAVDNSDAWFSRSSPVKDEIASAVGERLNRMLADAVDEYNSGYPGYISAGLIISNFYTLGILNDITRQTRAYAEENNLFLLSDVAALLSGIINGNEAPFIYEKTGHFYRHFMIDEFQDTSRMQWSNFVPLIKNSLSENRRNILVGDVKQSIYRWRSGDWRILAGEAEEEMRLFEPVVKPLEINWRSKKNIVDFNNMLFSSAPQVIQDQFTREFESSTLPEEYGESLKSQIASAYVEHYQKVPDKSEKAGGYVSVKFMDNAGSDWKSSVLEGVPGLIISILQRGYSAGDIAILVRNHSEGRDIANSLLQWQAMHRESGQVNLEFISEEFLLLRESFSVQLIVAVLRFISAPDDSINRAQVINMYCRYLGGMPPEKLTDHDLFATVSPEDDGAWERLLPHAFTSDTDGLVRLSLYELVEKLIMNFGLNDVPGEVPYLMAFQDVVLDYSKKEAGSAGSFAEWWEEHGGSFSVSSSDRQDAMRIMTIHKSKGLQFKVVVIPFGEWNIDHNPLHDNFLWCKPGSPPFDRLELVPVKYKSELANSIFAGNYFDEKMQVFVDNLNLLYVAFTRPEEELHVFTPLPDENRKDKEKIRSVSDILYPVLTGISGPRDDVSHMFAGNDDGNITDCDWDDNEKWFSAGKAVVCTEKPKNGTGDGLMLDEYRVNNFRDKLRLRLYGSLFFDKEAEKGQRIARGRLMHEIFESIVTAGDVPKAVEQKCYEGLIGKDEAGALAGDIERLIGDKRVAHWYDGSWHVRNETAILLKSGRTRRPDRVMTRKDEVVVVDYKFGDYSPSVYEGQVRRYMSELTGMGYNNVTGYVWFVLSGELEEVKSDI